MDLITRTELEQLAASASGLHISLYLPTHRAGRETGGIQPVQSHTVPPTNPKPLIHRGPVCMARCMEGYAAPLRIVNGKQHRPVSERGKKQILSISFAAELQLPRAVLTVRGSQGVRLSDNCYGIRITAMRDEMMK